MARHSRQQVLRLARTIWQGERAQRLDSPGFLVGAVGEGEDYPFPSEESAGRLSALDVHDAGCRHCGGESLQRLASARPGWIAGKVEGEAFQEGHGLRAALEAAPGLAYRRFLHQHRSEERRVGKEG